MPVARMLPLVHELCTFRTGVVADENESLFARIADEIDLEILRFPSGLSHNGWVIPDNWEVKKALVTREGTPVFDGTAHTLGVGYYSRSFAGTLDWDELEPHLVTNPQQPDAFMFHCEWQYRPWAADWRLSIPYRIYRDLGPGTYEVELVTERRPGEMLVGIHEHRGASDKTIVLNSNNCHPHMANDGFAGTAVLIRLMQWLRGRETHYSYRLVLAPEHLGSVFYLASLTAEEIDAIVSAVFEEMPGTPGPIKATSTFIGGQHLDLAIANALKHHAAAWEIVGWRKGAGNDETVWEAPGYEIPCTEITRCEEQFNPYPQYHSSLDTPELMDEDQLQEMVLVLQKAIDALERDVTMQRTFDGLICLSNPEYDLYMERPDPTVDKQLDEQESEKWGHLLDCLLRYFDGSTSVLDIAEQFDLPFEPLRRYIDRYAEAGLVTLSRREIERDAARKLIAGAPALPGVS